MSKKHGGGANGSNPSKKVSNMAAPTVASTAKDNAKKNRAEGLKIVQTTDVQPAKLRLVDKFRGRANPVGMEDVTARADSMRVQGQLQPLQVRPVQGTDEFEVIFGNTRKRAGDMIATGYTSLDGKTIEPKSDYTLRVEVVECSDEEAFKRNVSENNERTQCSPIDNAINQDVLRKTFEMSDAAITRLYGYGHQSSVTQLKKILGLERGFLDLIHEGSLTLNGGLLLLEVEGEANRNKLWGYARDIAGKEGAVGSSDMKAAIVKFKKEAAEGAGAVAVQTAEGTTVQPGEAAPEGEAAPPSVSQKNYQLSLKVVKEGFAQIAADPACPDQVVTICISVQDYIAGKSDLSTLAKNLLAACGAARKDGITPGEAQQAVETGGLESAPLEV